MTKADGQVKIDTALDTKNVENGLKSLKSTAGTMAKAVGVAIGSGLAFATKAGMDFESQMSAVGAISLATAEDMEILSSKAKQMGIDTVFSATEAGKAFEYMAQAGWKTEQMLGGIEGIMNLAAASGEDLGMVSDIVTDSLTAFGLAAEDATRFSDVLATASAASNTNVAMMGETFKYVAPVAGAMGYSIEDTSKAIGLMANAGIKASQAGTSLRQILLGMQGGVELSAKSFGTLKFNIENADGSMKALDEVLTSLRSAFAQMTAAEKAANAEVIAGKIGMSGLLAIVNASEKDYKNLGDAIENSAGSAKEMSEIRLDNLKGQLTLLGSSAEGLGIAVYEGISEPLKDAVKVGIESLNKLTDSLDTPKMKKALDNIGKLLGDIVETLSSIVSAVLPPLISTLGVLGNNIEFLLPLVVGIFAAMKGYQVIVAVNNAWNASKVAVDAYTAALTRNSLVTEMGGTVSLLLGSTLKANEIIVGVLTKKITLLEGAQFLCAKAQLALNAAWHAHPIGLVIAGVVALTGVIAGLCLALNKETEEEKALRIAREENIAAIEERKKAYEDMKQSQLESVTSSYAEITNIQKLADELNRLADESGKVADGDRARAEFIIGQLNEALGTEISMTDGVIQNYRDLQSEIYKTIEAKKLEILLEASEEQYAEAIKNKAAALKEYTQAEEAAGPVKQRLNELYAEQIRYEQEAQKAREQGDWETAAHYGNLVNNAKTAYDNLYNARHKDLEALNTAKSTYEGYCSDIEGYETAKTIAQKDGTNAAIQYLEEQSGAVENLGTVQQKFAGDVKKQQEELSKSYKGALLEYKTWLGEYKKTGSESALSNVLAAMEKLKSTQSDLATLGVTFADGFLTSAEGLSLPLDSLLTQVEGSEADFAVSGKYISLGVAKGIKDGEADCLQSAIDLINNTKTAANEAAGINSPAKEFEDGTGVFIPLGVAKGIEKEADTVSDAAVDSIIDANDAAGDEAALSYKNGEAYVDGVAVGIVDSSYKVSDAVQAMFDDLDLKRDIGVYTAKEYYANMEALRDKYIKKGTKEWWNYTKELMSFKAEQYEENIEMIEQADTKELELKKKLGIVSANDEAYILSQRAKRYKQYSEEVLSLEYLSAEKRDELNKKYLEEAQDTYVEAYTLLYDNIKEQYDELISEVDADIDELFSMQQNFENKLKSQGELFYNVTFKGIGKNGEDEDAVLLTDWDKEAEKLNAYYTALTKLKERIGSKELYNQIAELDFDEGLKVIEQLNSLNDNDLEKYVSGFENYQLQSEQSAEGAFSDQIDDLSQVKDELKTDFEDTVNNMRLELAEFYGDVPEDFFKLGTESADNFETAFNQRFNAILESIKSRFSNIINSLIPEFVFDGAGVSTTTSYYDNRSTTINAGNNASAHEIVEAQNQQSLYESHTKGWE